MRRTQEKSKTGVCWKDIFVYELSEVLFRFGFLKIILPQITQLELKYDSLDTILTDERKFDKFGSPEAELQLNHGPSLPETCEGTLHAYEPVEKTH